MPSSKKQLSRSSKAISAKFAPLDETGKLRRWLYSFVFFGIFIRAFRYAMPIPFNSAEAAMGLNIINRGYRELLNPLDYGQVARLGFLWKERFIYESFGNSDHSLRALPMAVGIAGLIFFAYWAWIAFKPLAATIATGILAAALPCVAHSVELQPDSFDFLAAVGLLLMASRYRLDGQSKWLLGLIVLTPVAMVLSYPAIFIIAGIELVLIISLPEADERARRLIDVLAFVIAICFGLLWWFDALGPAWRSIHPLIAGFSPVFIVLMGIGIAYLIDLIKNAEKVRWLVARVVQALLIGIGIGALAAAMKQTKNTEDDVRARDVAQSIVQSAPPDTTIAMLQPRESTPVNVQWYLRQADDKIVWDAAARTDWQNPGPIYAVAWQWVEPGSADVIADLQERVEKSLDRGAEDHSSWFLSPTGKREEWQLDIIPAAGEIESTQPATVPSSMPATTASQKLP